MKIFENISQMKLAHLTNGQFVQVKGGVLAGDGSWGFYLIAPSGGGESLASGNVALLQPVSSITSSDVVINVPSLQDLRDLVPVTGMTVYLREDGRAGHFKWSSIDHAADVTADTQSGIYVAPSSDLTGASGAWVREYSGAVTPSWFSSDDLEAVQFALSYCVANSIETILLDREYDLTGGTVFLSTVNYSHWVCFHEGGLKKTDGGFMFSRSVSDRGTDAPRFYNVSFEGDTSHVNQTIIIDGDNMIRPVVSDCYFDGISLVHSTEYTQSVRMDGCEMFRATDKFIAGENHLDLVITNNKCETSPDYPLLYALSDTGLTAAVTVGRITNNVIEGYTNVAPIQISSASALDISSNYFEANKVDIDFIASTGLRNVSGTIANNGFFGSLDDKNIKFNSTNTSKLSVNNNTSNIPNSATKGLMTADVYIAEKNYMSAGGTLILGGRSPIQRTLDILTTTLSEVTAGVGLRVQIDNFMRKDNPIFDMLGMSFLINISGTMRSTTEYRASYTGILSIVGTLSNTVQAVVMLTHLNKAGTDGGSDNAQGVDANISVQFLNAGSDTVPTTTENESIVIDFSELDYKGVALVEKATIIPLSTILNESTYYTPKY